MKIRSLSLLTITAMLIVSVPAAAQANEMEKIEPGAVTELAALAEAQAEAIAENGLSASDEQRIRESLTRGGVTPATQQQLLDKLLNGEPWDSMTGGATVSTVESTSNNVETKIETYADGSVAIHEMEIPVRVTAPTEGMMSPMAVSGCIDYQGVGTWPFKSCKAWVDYGTYALDFYADGRISNIGNAGIERVFVPGWFIAGATYVSHSLTIPVPNDTPSSRAWARLSVYANFTPGAGSGTWKLNFYVNDMSRTTTVG